jgi:prepilin-type N-terminal cleavage/methylation domain-containing protein
VLRKPEICATPVRLESLAYNGRNEEKAMGQTNPERRAASGYTLIEMLVVMGIILLMVALVLVSIGSMLRGTKMANTVNLFVSAADEARTAGITLRRAVQVDLTRLDAEGRFNRLTTIGAYICDNFEGNTLQTPLPGTPNPPTNWNPMSAGTAYPAQDGTYCMYIKAGGKCYNSTFGIQRFEEGSEDYEALLQARVKFKQAARTGSTWRLRLEGSVDTTYTNRYGVAVEIETAANDPLNVNTKVILEKSGSPVKTTDLHAVKGPPASTVRQSLIKEGIWYRIKLSVKRYTRTNDAGAETQMARVSGKVWVDGQLEPPEWTVGPYDDTTSPIAAGFGGFSCEGNDILVDDVFFDLRAIRPLPKGLKIDMLYPEADTQSPARWTRGALVNQDGPSPFNFPIVFRPDGTSAKRYIVRLTDLATGDKRYVVVEQNTGRTRPADAESEALGQ